MGPAGIRWIWFNELLIPTQHMIRRLGQLYVIRIRPILAHKPVLPSAQKTLETVLQHLIIIIHVSPTRSASRNLVNRFLHWIHFIRYRRNHHAQRHSESTVQRRIVRHVCVWKLVRTRIVLWVLHELLKLCFKLCLLLVHLGLLWHELRPFIALRNVGLWRVLGLLFSFFENLVHRHFIFIF